MLQNARFTAFTVSAILRENQQGLVKLPPVHSTSWKFGLHFIHIFRVDLMFLNKFGSSDPSFRKRILTLFILAGANCSYSLINIIYKFLDMIRILNIHWGYFLINNVCELFYQLDHVNFSKNVFQSVNFALAFCQICCIQKSTLDGDISTKMLHKL